MAPRTAGHVYLFEFKAAEMAPPGSALAGTRLRRQVPLHVLELDQVAVAEVRILGQLRLQRDARVSFPSSASERNT